MASQRWYWYGPYSYTLLQCVCTALVNLRLAVPCAVTMPNDPAPAVLVTLVSVLYLIHVYTSQACRQAHMAGIPIYSVLSCVISSNNLEYSAFSRIVVLPSLSGNPILLPCPLPLN